MLYLSTPPALERPVTEATAVASKLLARAEGVVVVEAVPVARAVEAVEGVAVVRVVVAVAVVLAFSVASSVCRSRP